MINIFQPIVYDETFELLKKIHDDHWLGKGNLAVQFEESMKSYLGVRNFATASCASHIIEAVIRVSKFPKESNIIIADNSFPILASVILSEGYICRIADVDASTGNISLESVKDLIDVDTAAVFVTHYGGIPVDIEALRAVIGEKVKIYEDSATALGTKLNKVSVGANSDFSLWSFDAMKLLVAGEGGGFSSKDDDLFFAVKSHLYLGLSPKEKSGLDKSNSSHGMWWEYQPLDFGTRSVFTDVQASYGLASLKYIEDRLSRLSAIRRRYEERISVPYISQVTKVKETQYSNYFFTLIVPDGKRDKLAIYLKEKGIYSTLRYYPISKIKIYNEKSHSIGPLKGSEKFSRTCLNIPIHASLTDLEVDYIIDSVNSFFNE